MHDVFQLSFTLFYNFYCSQKHLFAMVTVTLKHTEGHYTYCVVCFVVALRPKSTAMVMVGWLVHLTTLFPGLSAVLSAQIFACT